MTVSLSLCGNPANCLNRETVCDSELAVVELVKIRGEGKNDVRIGGDEAFCFKVKETINNELGGKDKATLIAFSWSTPSLTTGDSITTETLLQHNVVVVCEDSNDANKVFD